MKTNNFVLIKEVHQPSKDDLNIFFENPYFDLSEDDIGLILDALYEQGVAQRKDAPFYSQSVCKLARKLNRWLERSKK